VMNIHLSNLKKNNEGALRLMTQGAEAKEQRALIDGYETLSEKFLDDYLKRHVKNPTKYPVGKGAVELGKQVYLRNTGKLLKQGREKEALQKMQHFITLASGQELPHGRGAESPRRLFNEAEWKTFVTHYAELFNDYKHPLLGAPKNSPSISQLIHNLKQQSIQVFKGNKEAESKLIEAIGMLNRESGYIHNADDIILELKETTGYTPGLTFKMMNDLLQKYKPTSPILSEMG
jgi:hypothetical protein